MRFKGTFALLIVAILFGGYIYFYEISGGQKREAARSVENRVWRFDAESIVRVALTSQDDHMAAERNDDGRWMMTAPREWLADNSQLDRLASYAARLDRESVVESNVNDLAQYGLSPAWLELRVTGRDGREYGIAFGETNPSGNSTYSVLIGDREVFFVSADAARAFDAKAEDFRDRNVLSFERARVQGVILRNQKGVVELEKDGDERWWFRGTEKREAGGPEVRELLNALQLGKITDFFNENSEDYENASLEKPVIDAVLTFGPDKELKRLVIGTERSELRKKSQAAADETAFEEMFLARDDSRNELFFVGTDIIEKLSKSVNDLRDKALVPFQRWDVDALVVENAEGTFQFIKIDGDWFLDGASKKKADWREINNIMDALEKPVVEWIDNPASLAGYGVDKPTSRVVLKKGSDVIAECAFGYSTTNGVYAKVSGDSSIKVADPDDLQFLTKSESDYLE